MNEPRLSARKRQTTQTRVRTHPTQAPGRFLLVARGSRSIFSLAFSRPLCVDVFRSRKRSGEGLGRLDDPDDELGQGELAGGEDVDRDVEFWILEVEVGVASQRVVAPDGPAREGEGDLCAVRREAVACAQALGFVHSADTATMALLREESPAAYAAAVELPPVIDRPGITMAAMEGALEAAPAGVAGQVLPQVLPGSMEPPRPAGQLLLHYACLRGLPGAPRS